MHDQFEGQEWLAPPPPSRAARLWAAFRRHILLIPDAPPTISTRMPPWTTGNSSDSPFL
jgi:hypothetical protein